MKWGSKIVSMRVGADWQWISIGVSHYSVMNFR